MIRIATAAALAALVAGPALAQEVRISVTGKSQAQVQAEVRYAARQVCHRQIETETLRLAAFARCMQQTLENTESQLARIEFR
jgi:hypothetical protein